MKFKNQLRINGFSGDIHFDIANRVINSTDNSIYELYPLGVIQPQNSTDLKILVTVANEPDFINLTFTPRGGGTGTNGQSLTHGIVVDTSCYMTDICELSIENKTVTVGPGVVLSELNRYLKPYGLMFAPNISTADRATIGGMIATDAAGKGSLIYGKTSDHIKSISAILINGESHQFNCLNHSELEEIATKNDFISHLQQTIKDLLVPVQDEIKERFPDLKRPLSGYNLRHAYVNAQLDITRLISGSEGTLCFIAEATLKLVPIPKYKRLIVVHYDTFLASLSDARFLINYTPLAIEVVDDKVQKSAESLPNWPEIAQLLNTEGRVSISNFVEFAENNEIILQEKTTKLIAELTKRGSRFALIENLADINKLWTIRSLAVGLAANISGSRKPIAFVEDAIVPTEYLHDFVRDFAQYLDSLNLSYAMYGHLDVGCIHVRPALDMQDAKDKSLIRPITVKTLELTDKYHGLLWGEHGKGVRGEFVKHVFGDKLYRVMAEIKALFDPNNRLNPGKLVNPGADMQKISKIDALPLRGDFDKVVAKKTQDEYISAFLCNGNAACFNQEPSNAMCPSYKITNNRIHSPKGRATLIKEWLRNRASDKKLDEIVIADEVFATMKECLGCKACAGKCPVKVGIPDLKTKFLDYYYKNYRTRTLREFASGHLEHVLSIAQHTPNLWNFMVKNHLMPSLGMVNIPTFSHKKSLKSTLKKMNVHFYKTPHDFKNVNKPIVILADVFSGLLEQNILFASIKVFKNLGYTPYILKPRVSGKALLVGGFLDKFKVVAKKWYSLLNPIFAKNIPVVGLENSVTLIFRDEFDKFAAPLDGQVETLAEILVKNDVSHLSISTTLIDENISYTLLPHCTEQALQAVDAKHWELIFKNVGLNLKAIAVGCCGMAGTYGHEKEHLVSSKKLFNMHWQPILDNNDSGQYLATGYSCRSQTLRLTNSQIFHPIEVLAAII